MATVEDVRTVAEQSKPDITEYLNCGYINRQIASALTDDLDIEASVVIGGLWQSRSNREEHAYVEIPAGALSDAGQSVIVDGAIRQFCEANRDDLWVVLGPREALPGVAVLTGAEENNWYSMYSPQRP